MSSLLQKIALVAAPVLLSACMTLPNSLILGETEEFDGTWTGRLMLSIGTEKCARRTPITVTIEDGTLDGRTKYKNFTAKIGGYISADGSLNKGSVEVQNDYYSYEIDGNFEGENAKGTWKSKDCAGKWDLRRIRRTVS